MKSRIEILLIIGILFCVCVLFFHQPEEKKKQHYEKKNNNFLWVFVCYSWYGIKRNMKKNHNPLCEYLFFCQPDFVGYSTSSWGCHNINLTILTCGVVCVCASMHIAHNGNAFKLFLWNILSLFFLTWGVLNFILGSGVVV